MNLFGFLSQVLSDNVTGEGSTKRVAYFATVVCLLATLLVITGIFIGLSVALTPSLEVLREFTSTFETVAAMAIAATTTGYVAGKLVERNGTKEE